MTWRHTECGDRKKMKLNMRYGTYFRWEMYVPYCTKACIKVKSQIRIWIESEKSEPDQDRSGKSEQDLHQIIWISNTGIRHPFGGPVLIFADPVIFQIRIPLFRFTYMDPAPTK